MRGEGEWGFHTQRSQLPSSNHAPVEVKNPEYLTKTVFSKRESLPAERKKKKQVSIMERMYLVVAKQAIADRTSEHTRTI